LVTGAKGLDLDNAHNDLVDWLVHVGPMLVIDAIGTPLVLSTAIVIYRRVTDFSLPLLFVRIVRMTLIFSV
jgi:hypothetical protein